MNKAPPRLLDDPNAPQSLRQQLSAAADMQPGYDVLQGLARFETGIAALSADDAAERADDELADVVLSASSQSWGPLSKLALLLLTGASLLSVWFYSAVGSRSEMPWEPDARELQPAPAPPASTKEVPARVAEPEQPPLGEGSVLLHSDAKPPHKRSETAQMLRARELLRTDAKAALALLQQLAREHPRGVLREEREGLTVLALWQTGDSLRARMLARRFLDNYPTSALRERLRPLLDEGGK